MKRIILIFIIPLYLLSSNNSYYYYNGIKKVIYPNVINGFEIYSHSRKYSGITFVDNQELIIEFSIQVSKEYFEYLVNKYSLILLKKLSLKHDFYIFKIKGESSIKISNTIFENEQYIQSASPNWVYRNIK
jgi:hypothetical protein